MSSRVTSVPAAQCPDEAGPGWHAWVNAPATTTSPLTTAVLQMVVALQPPDPNQVSHTDVVVVPANTFGVQGTGAADTRPGSGTAALAGTTPNKTSAALMAEASIAPGTSRRMRFLRVQTGGRYFAGEHFLCTRRLTYGYGLRRAGHAPPRSGPSRSETLPAVVREEQISHEITANLSPQRCLPGGPLVCVAVPPDAAVLAVHPGRREGGAQARGALPDFRCGGHGGHGQGALRRR